MDNKFDELAKGLAQSITRRQALKEFSIGLAGMAAALLGFVNKAHGGLSHNGCFKQCFNKCSNDCIKAGGDPTTCTFDCQVECNAQCGAF